jgi:hypothetical protein
VETAVEAAEVEVCTPMIQQILLLIVILTVAMEVLQVPQGIPRGLQSLVQLPMAVMEEVLTAQEEEVEQVQVVMPREALILKLLMDQFMGQMLVKAAAR